MMRHNDTDLSDSDVEIIDAVTSIFQLYHCNAADGSLGYAYQPAQLYFSTTVSDAETLAFKNRCYGHLPVDAVNFSTNFNPKNTRIMACFWNRESRLTSQ